MTRAVSLANLVDEPIISVDGVNNRIGINSTQPTEKLDVVGVVSATSFFGNGANLTGIIAGATLSAGSGDQRVVVTSLTSGTMTSAATDAELTYNSTTNTLSATTFSGALTGSASGTAGGLTGTPNIDCGTGSFTGDVDIADKIVHTGDTNTAIRFPAADTFTVETAGSEALRITSAGLVGIGTDNPEEILHVAAASETVNSRDGVMLQSTSALAADTGLPLVFTSHVGTVVNYGVASIAGRKENAVSGEAGGYLQFATATSGGSIQERLRVDSGGKVGVNIDNPGSYNSAGNEIVLGNTGNNGGMTIVSGTGNNGHIFFADGTGTPNQGIIKYEHANDAMAFNTNTGERLRILSGGGLTFNGDSATANALDDYEEGTWTPGVGGSATYTTQTGTYTKVGRLVYVTCNMQINVIGTGSATTITTLPYAGSGGLENSSAVGYWTTLSRSVTSLMACLNSTQVVFTDTTSATTGTGLNSGIFQNGTNVRFSLCYQV